MIIKLLDLIQQLFVIYNTFYKARVLHIIAIIGIEYHIKKHQVFGNFERLKMWVYMV